MFDFTGRAVRKIGIRNEDDVLGQLVVGDLATADGDHILLCQRLIQSHDEGEENFTPAGIRNWAHGRCALGLGGSHGDDGS